MVKRIASVIVPYIIAAAVFSALLLFPKFLQQTVSPALVFDPTFLILVSMMACAWYLGRGPGLLMAVLLEGVLSYFSPGNWSSVITINRLLLFVGVVWFASSRRKAEVELRRQRELLQVTLSSIADAVVAADKDHTVTFLNHAAEVLTGWTSSEAIGHPVEEICRIVDSADEHRVPRLLPELSEKSQETGEGIRLLLIARDGTEIPVDSNASQIRDRNGSSYGDVVVFRDISLQRQAESERENLLAKERSARGAAEVAGRLKDEFLATVSHELRTPLNAILGWAAMLKENSHDPESMKKAVDVIERNARTQNEMIGDILDVSGIITGKLKIESRPVDLVPIIRGAVETVYPASMAKSIEILTKFESADPVVTGDPDRLQQVVWNLLSNAIKFTPPGGTVEITLTDRAPDVVVTVSDSGIGISEDFLPFVFDRFRQVDSSMKRSHGGLGLGLAIVRHLVELHGGGVEAVSSGSGHGAVFSVTLPFAGRTETAADQETTPRHGPDLSGIRVLVVDDHPDTLEMFCTALNVFGAETIPASSGAGAINAFQNFQPDVILSDIGMAGMDGFDLLRKIREIEQGSGKRVPAAAVSAYTRDEDREKALISGFQMHIPKPVDAADLARAVEELVNTEIRQAA